MILVLHLDSLYYSHRIILFPSLKKNIKIHILIYYLLLLSMKKTFNGSILKKIKFCNNNKISNMRI